MRRKIFIDCGFHHGEGLKMFINKLGIDRNWLVYAFEPNPACNLFVRFYEIVGGAVTGIPGLPINAAVWTHYGSVNFRQENHYKSESGSPADGTSIVDGWASQLDDLHGTSPGLEAPITVDSYDFSAFVLTKHIVHNSADIYCKMDIEGAEFAVLRKMIADGTIQYIKKIWIEFHENSVPGESIYTKQDLIKQLSQFTEVELWH